RRATDVEAERLAEHFFIPVPRGIEEEEQVALADLLSPDLGVCGGGSAKMDDGRRPAQYFLDGGRQQAGIGTPPILLSRSLHEGPESAGSRVTGRLVPGHRQQGAVGEDVEVRQRLAVDAALYERAHQILARLATTLGHVAPEVLEERESRSIGGLERRRTASVFGFPWCDRLVRPLEDDLPILARHAEQLQN